MLMAGAYWPVPGLLQICPEEASDGAPEREYRCPPYYCPRARQHWTRCCPATGLRVPAPGETICCRCREPDRAPGASSADARVASRQGLTCKGCLGVTPADCGFSITDRCGLPASVPACCCHWEGGEPIKTDFVRKFNDSLYKNRELNVKAECPRASDGNAAAFTQMSAMGSPFCSSLSFYTAVAG